MARKYTAQEMRDMALVEEAFGWDVSADMLLHAADMMEREEKREKKYEFSVHPPEVYGVFQYRAGAELKAFILKQDGYRDATVVRREVGEWEEVKDEDSNCATHDSVDRRENGVQGSSPEDDLQDRAVEHVDLVDGR